MTIDNDFEDEEILPDNMYLVMWDNTGLECIIEIDMFKIGDGGDMLAILEDTENTYAKKLSGMLKMMKLRAQFNTQRHYEIYGLRTSGSITKEQLEFMFENNPQSTVDLIREKGIKIRSDRASERQVIF